MPPRKKSDAAENAMLDMVRVVCEVHGEHNRHIRAERFENGRIQEYPYCPYCFGEWIAEMFPVRKPKVGRVKNS